MIPKHDEDFYGWAMGTKFRRLFFVSLLVSSFLVTSVLAMNASESDDEFDQQNFADKQLKKTKHKEAATNKPISFSKMEEEEKYSIETHTTALSAITALRKTIKSQINTLIDTLEKDEGYKKEAIGKGWLNQTQQEQGKLIQFLKEIDPSKKRVLEDIAQYFKSKELPTERLSVLDIIDEIKKLPSVMIEAKIREYFSSIGYTIEPDGIRDKGEGNGVQFGKIVRIKKQSEEMEYFVKTHQLGLLSQTGRSAQPVDLKEVFAYKFLVLCGISPEVHFFYDDEKYFYIATKNDGYSKDGSTEFITYDKVKQDTCFQEKNAKLIADSFLVTDMYSRILDISDVFTNSSNVGFIKTKELSSFVYRDNSFRIIDFRTPSTRANYKLNDIYGGWVSGNNQYNYEDKFVVSVLKNENIEEKKEQIIPLLKIIETINKNVEESFNYIDEIAKKIYLKESYEKSIKDLKTYTDVVRRHYIDLWSGIHKRSYESMTE